MGGHARNQRGIEVACTNFRFPRDGCGQLCRAGLVYRFPAEDTTIRRRGGYQRALDDATRIAVSDQLDAGVDILTDGECAVSVRL